MSVVSKEENESVQILLKCPFTMMIVGPTKSGKTTFTDVLLKQSNIHFTESINKIFYFYNQIIPSNEYLVK